jgi:hypothetical protein
MMWQSKEEHQVKTSQYFEQMEELLLSAVEYVWHYWC